MSKKANKQAIERLTELDDLCTYFAGRYFMKMAATLGAEHDKVDLLKHRLTNLDVFFAKASDMSEMPKELLIPGIEALKKSIRSIVADIKN